MATEQLPLSPLNPEQANRNTAYASVNVGESEKKTSKDVKEEKGTDAGVKSADKWIFYHIPIKCRGNFTRLVLEESGVDWIDAYGYQTIGGLFRSPMYDDCEADPYCQGYPNRDVSKLIDPDHNICNIALKDRIYDSYGSPCLVNYNNPLITLSQTPMIVQFVADKYGLRPKSTVDHYLAGMIVTNCNDFFDMIRMIERDLKANEDWLLKFMNGKYRVWLNMIVKPLGDRLYYFDNRITQSDLALYNILDCLLETFGQNEKLLNHFVWKPHPNLKVFYENIVKESKAIASLMKRQNDEGITWWPLRMDEFNIKVMYNTLLQWAEKEL